MFDLDARKFKTLVAEGYFPPGFEIAPGVMRWDTETLKRIANGGGPDGWEQIHW